MKKNPQKLFKNEVPLTKDAARYLVVFKDRAGEDKKKGTQEEGLMWECGPQWH